MVFQREWNQFVSFVHQQFHLRLKTLQEDELQKLSEKSGVMMPVLQKLASTVEKYKYHEELTGTELIEVNKAIGAFYQEHRKNYGKSGNTKRTAKPA